jgi:hypothetical protein
MAFVSVALLFGVFFACKPKQDSQPIKITQDIPDVQVVSSLSPVQKRMIQRRGYPDLFAVTFDHGNTNKEADFTQRRKTRRVDTWLYLGTINRMVVFDNGYFVEEENITGNIVINAKTHMKPSHFGTSLSKADIIGRYGQPHNEENLSIENRALSILTYIDETDKPKMNFGFVNNALIAVTIGFSFEEQRTL